MKNEELKMNMLTENFAEYNGAVVVRTKTAFRETKFK